MGSARRLKRMTRHDHRAGIGPGPVADPIATRTRRVKVSLTMIVRDEAANLPACLDSAAGLFDELVIVDTGSTDDSKDIARSYGAKVSDFAWCDDFSKARNAALDRAAGDYAFWLDADDRIDPDQRAGLAALLDSLRPGDAAAYLMRVPITELGRFVRIIDHMRLFPLREGVRWTYPLHEWIEPGSLIGVPVRRSDVVIRHTGYDDPDVLARKNARNERIFDAHIPGPLRLALQARSHGDWDAVDGHIRDFARDLGPYGVWRLDPTVARLYYLTDCDANLRRGDLAVALEAGEGWLRVDPDDEAFLGMRRFLLSKLGRAEGRFAGA
jgi:glycosyltransferase involved in cell wall biosynthesis